MAIDIVARALAVSGKQNLENYYTKTESDAKYSQATNLENGAGENSIQQKYIVGEVDYSAKASGINSIALGGKRFDKLTDTTRTSTSAEGNQSFAAGGSVHAHGDFSVAMGKDNESYQRMSVSLGGGNKAGLTEEEFNTVYASNIRDGVIYDDDGATYDTSSALNFALGEVNDVTGRGSLGAGTSNVVAGRNAIGLGFSNEARAYCSIAMNYDCIASGLYSTAMNYKTIAKGEASFAANEGGEASGNYSAKFGRGSKAIGSDSFVAGNQTEAQKWAGVAFGVGTKSSAQVQTVIGRYNKVNESEDASNWELFQVGNGWGSADNQRSNAFSVLYDGRAKVKSAPVENDDVLRLNEFSVLTQEQISSLF